MSGGRTEIRARLPVFVESAIAEAGVGVLVVCREIEIVLNQKSASECVIAYSVAANPGINERKCENEEKQKETLSKWDGAKIEQRAYFFSNSFLSAN
jgi:hypothetical protein